MSPDRLATLRAVCAVLALAGVLVVTLMVEGPVIELRSRGAFVMLTVLWIVPTVAYWSLVRSAPASFALGVALAVGLPVALRAVILTDSSTAGLGILSFGILWWVVVGGVVALERSVSARLIRRTSRRREAPDRHVQSDLGIRAICDLGRHHERARFPQRCLQITDTGTSIWTC